MASVDTLAKIGNFLSGVSLLIAAGIGALTLVRINIREKDRTWAARFRALYSEFWNDEDILQVFRWIVNDREYGDIKDILAKRNTTVHNQLDKHENDKILKIDKFCAAICRAQSLQQEEKMSGPRRQIWEKLSFHYVLTQLKRRPEFKEYVQKYWRETFD
jgi:hypothetical protein